jgi:A/G-specific adenine glycosylase
LLFSPEEQIVNQTFRGDYALLDMVTPLLAWYEKNARNLPWREDTDPYRVWVSEIMLQQTRVDAVIPYYTRFMRELPNVESLAKVDEEKLMKLWEGLGYYRRARNLHKAAQVIMEKHGGIFPKDYLEIRALPGIGDYTAGAISSICFDQPVSAVDGNVLRVIARLTGSYEDVSKTEVKRKTARMLEAVYPEDRCGEFTQALMELGAVICLPNGMPKCEDCPLAFMCRAFESGTQMDFPVKTKKSPRKMEEKTVFLIRCGESIALRQREANALLGGLWEFPNVDGNLTLEQAQNVLRQWDVSFSSIEEGIRKKHIFTHVQWSMTSVVVITENMPDAFTWVTKETLLSELSLPSAFRVFIGLL